MKAKGVSVLVASLLLSWVSAARAASTAEMTLNKCQRRAAKEMRSYEQAYFKAVGGCMDGVGKAVIQKQGDAPPAVVGDAAPRCVKAFRRLVNTEDATRTLVARLATKVRLACDPASNPTKILHDETDVLGTGAELAEQIDAQHLNSWCANYGGGTGRSTIWTSG
jgi:hypothetical protein